MKKQTITKKQIELSKQVLFGKKSYRARTSTTDAIESAILAVEEKEMEAYIKEYGNTYTRFSRNEFMPLYEIENELRKQGFRIWGDK